MSICIFCEIAAGRLPSYRVFEDEHTVAFLDLRPASTGHTLVVPRAHATDVWEISEAAHAEVAATVHRVAALLNTTLAPDGLNVKHNSGESAGQDILHYHVHLMPRWHGDDLPRPRSSPLASTEELEKVLERIYSRR